MKMLMIVCDDKMLDSTCEMLKARQITGYTEIPSVHGVGHHGEKKESAVAPGAYSLLFSAMEDDAVDTIIEDLKDLRESYQETVPFGLRIFVMEMLKMV